MYWQCIPESCLILLTHLDQNLGPLRLLPVHLERILKRVRRLIDDDRLTALLAVDVVPHRSRVAHSDAAGGNVFGDDTTGADGGVGANGDAREDSHPRTNPDSIADDHLSAPAARFARDELATLLEPDRVADADDGHTGAERALLADDDVGDRGVEDGAVSVDEGRGGDLHTEAVVHIDRLLDVGDRRSGARAGRDGGDRRSVLGSRVMGLRSDLSLEDGREVHGGRGIGVSLGLVGWVDDTKVVRSACQMFPKVLSVLNEETERTEKPL